MSRWKGPGRYADKLKTDEKAFDLCKKAGIVPDRPISRSWWWAVELGGEWRPLSLLRQSPNSGVCSWACGDVGDVGPNKRAIDRGLRQCTWLCLGFIWGCNKDGRGVLLSGRGVPIGVAVGVVSAISFVARIGSGEDNLGPSGKTNDALEERDEEDGDGEGGAANEGLKEDIDDDSGLNRERPESICDGGSDSIDDSIPKPPSDSVEEPGISRRKDEFKLWEDRNEVESVAGSCPIWAAWGNMKPPSSSCCVFNSLPSFRSGIGIDVGSDRVGVELTPYVRNEWGLIPTAGREAEKDIVESWRVAARIESDGWRSGGSRVGEDALGWWSLYPQENKILNWVVRTWVEREGSWKKKRRARNSHDMYMDDQTSIGSDGARVTGPSPWCAIPINTTKTKLTQPCATGEIRRSDVGYVGSLRLRSQTWLWGYHYWQDPGSNRYLTGVLAVNLG